MHSAIDIPSILLPPINVNAAWRNQQAAKCDSCGRHWVNVGCMVTVGNCKQVLNICAEEQDIFMPNEVDDGKNQERKAALVQLVHAKSVVFQ